MRVNKETGKVKLEKGEIRVGNFFIKVETDHIKIQDLNSMFSHRINRRLAIGIWLGNMIELGEPGIKSIENYIATLWTVSTVVMDADAVNGFLDVAKEAINRHPEWYGGKIREESEEKDAEALKAVEEMEEFKGDLEKAIENAQENEGKED